ncbi:MAG: hypothetical protein HFI20_02425 [Lachnospiraceae bacterium]|jgi:hypothetical protein|nr:hypothetical protein [Lachnospiraceae bacterium]MCI9017946.1 hypothetical protein [Lachnospiraceae bacterium]MCI9680304.1 hypothetical protein [Lachnospiraceae bacterium]
MANILRVTTPPTGYENNVRNNAQNQPDKMQIQNPVDPNRVVRPDNRSDANSQNGAQLSASYDSNFGTFVQLLRDTPQLSDTMSKLMFGGMANLVEAGIGADTAEDISTFFQLLKMTDAELVEFLKNQLSGSVRFQGPFFALMREALNNAPTVEQRAAILAFLKRYSDMSSGKHLMENMKDLLSDIKKYMFHEQRELLDQLTRGLNHRGPQDTGQNTARLQQDIIPFLAKYVAQTRNMGSLRDLVAQLTYNAARYENGDLDQLISDFKNLLKFPSFQKTFEGMDEEQLRELLMRMNFDKAAGKCAWADKFLSIVESGMRGDAGLENRQVFENVVNALLLNESVYMPVLHLMLPIELNGQLMFSEMWIDPDEDGDASSDPKERTAKLLIKFDIKDVGFFDLLMVYEKENVSMRLFYPDHLSSFESDIKKGMGEILERNGLNCEYLGVEQAKGSIPVSAVFPKIFERKNSVNVTI